MIKSAVISECSRYRYSLHRRWSLDKKKDCMFIMLNPSTADETTDDPTIRRCIGFAKQFGFGSLTVVNLFPIRATNPNRIKNRINNHSNFWLDNHLHIMKAAKKAGIIIAAWGNGPSNIKDGIKEQSIAVCKHLDDFDVQCLGTTKAGNPKHPLYLANNTKLELF